MSTPTVWTFRTADGAESVEEALKSWIPSPGSDGTSVEANLPARRAHGRRAARTLTPEPEESPSEAASHAVKVEFVDAEDKVLDTVVVGVEDAPPDRTVTARADSREAAGVKTFPRVAPAGRG